LREQAFFRDLGKRLKLADPGNLESHFSIYGRAGVAADLRAI